MELGDLSAQYESNGDPSTVSTGENDAGGVSYGTYQLASNVGSVDAFLGWGERAGGYYTNYARALINAGSVNSEGFISKWKELGTVDPQGFQKMQHDYMVHSYYDPAKEALAEMYLNLDKHSDALKQVVWSRVVQYGIGDHEDNTGLVGIFDDALEMLADRLHIYAPNYSYIDHIRFDYDLIACVYDVCMTREWNNSALRDNLNIRFESEKAQALGMLMSELEEKGY